MEDVTSSAEETPVEGSWTRPEVEVISLDCEISAYAPDGGGPLF